jgi:hypothetical protein
LPQAQLLVPQVSGWVQLKESESQTSPLVVPVPHLPQKKPEFHRQVPGDLHCAPPAAHGSPCSPE